MTIAGMKDIGPFTKRHKLVHNGRFPTFEALHYSQNIVKIDQD